MPETVEQQLISLRDAAKIAGVSYPSIWRAHRRGELRAIRVGDASGPLRVDRQEFLDWLYREPEEAAS